MLLDFHLEKEYDVLFNWPIMKNFIVETFILGLKILPTELLDSKLSHLGLGLSLLICQPNIFRYPWSCALQHSVERSYSGQMRHQWNCWTDGDTERRLKFLKFLLEFMIGQKIEALFQSHTHLLKNQCCPFKF